MKFLISAILFLSLAIPAVSQSFVTNNQQVRGNRVDQASIIDTVTVRRNALATAIYNSQGEKMTHRELRRLYYNTPAAAPLKWSQSMRIAAPIATAGGIALGAIALKGTVRTYEANDRTYYYTRRSKPNLAAGLVLLAGGLCLFEWSNDLLAKSARLYNLEQVRKAGRMKAQVGVTGDGVGLLVKF